MKISVTSDVHIRESNPEARVYLENFLKNPKVQNSDYIIFLGDIFDLMVGAKKQYLKEFDFFFLAIKKMAEEGRKIIYIEGNHDFHLEDVFKKINSSQIKVIRTNYELEDKGKRIRFEHGDELDLYNKSYKRWKKIYSSSLMGFLLKFIFPYWMIRGVGNRASTNSKKQSSRTFSLEFEKKKYRENFKKYSQANVDIFVMGHTHIQDHYEFNGKVYLNNGYPPAHNQYIYIENGQWQFLSALDS